MLGKNAEHYCDGRHILLIYSRTAWWMNEASLAACIRTAATERYPPSRVLRFCAVQDRTSPLEIHVLCPERK